LVIVQLASIVVVNYAFVFYNSNPLNFTYSQSSAKGRFFKTKGRLFYNTNIRKIARPLVLKNRPLALL
jgi:hypothetical protein